VAGKNERQRRQARERYRRQQELRTVRQRQVRKRWLTGFSAVAAAGLIAALLVVFLPGGSAKKDPSAAAKKSPSASASASATATASTVAEPAHHCTYTKATPVSRKVSFPPATPDYKAAYQATISTNRGAIVIDLLNSKATCTVNSFVHLAEQSFFNNTPCPRLSNSDELYMLQCGDPTGKGTGGPGYEFASENLTGATYPAGTLAMANTGAPDSNGSQFFLVYKNSSLPPDYTPFGKIVSGLNILQTVAKGGYGKPLSSGGGGAPKEKVEIESVTIKQT